MNYKLCHIEQRADGLWYIVNPDCTKSWRQGYKTKGWATRTLNLLVKK